MRVVSSCLYVYISITLFNYVDVVSVVYYPRGIGPTRMRSTCKKDCVRAEMEQEQSKHDRARERRLKQRDTASEVSKAMERV